MCMTNPVFSCQLDASFSVFPIFFQAKKVNHYEDYVNFQDIEHQLQGNIRYHVLHYNFL